MKRRLRGVATLSSLSYFLVGLLIVTSLSFYQGYVAKLESASFVSNSGQWIASILFSWGLLLIFFTSARRTIRAAWALVVIILALGVGRFFSTQSNQTQYIEPIFSSGMSQRVIVDQGNSGSLLEVSDLNQSYQQAVLEAGWYTILDISRLQQDTDLVESYFIIEETRQAILQHLLQTQQRVHELEQQLYDSEASAKVETEYINDLIVQSQLQKEIWKSELAALKEVKSIITMLDADREAWTIKDGQLLFYSEADKQRFEEIVENLKAIAAEQTNLNS